MGTDQRDSSKFVPGRLVGGRLRIEAQLGRGGAASVHRARDERSGRSLAIKQLHAPATPEGALLASQFEREYHTLCQLAHPRIIEVYDYGLEHGSPYYTMELLDGEDLHNRGPVPWKLACALLCDVASSLAILHSRRLVHRDLSARNVRCTGDGRAKLIDFGAMTTMGAAKHATGTPPYVPPEALQFQALDGRADLYGLGALAYFTLTGYHAYHARSFAQLRDLWRSPPLSPRQYVSSLPEALDQLVMELLQLDRTARPTRAAEVIERLAGIAELPVPELPEVSRAYLVMPKLIGRDAQLREATTALAQMALGRGGSVLIQGQPGSGRSRMLEACVLEAKIAGALVLRADAQDGAAGDYGVARALYRQLNEELPELYEQCNPVQKAALDQLQGPTPGAESQPLQRPPLQMALRAVMQWPARERSIVIALDDFEAVDEPSAALMGALVHAASLCRLTLLLTSTDAAPPCAALALIKQLARPLSIGMLEASQTEALLRSVFGNVDQVAALASWVHRLSRGNPRATLALCEHLVERGQARYDAGSWLLPNALAAGDMPVSMRQALTSRLAALSPDERELAQALSLSEPGALSARDYPALTEHADSARVYRALDDLIARDLLVPEGERHRFSQEDLRKLLQAEIPRQQAHVLHGRLARVLSPSADPLLRCHHLMHSDQERAAIEVLLNLLQKPDAMFTARAPDLLEQALAAAEQLSSPWGVRLQLRAALLRVCSVLGRSPPFIQHAEIVLQHLQRDTGLYDCAESIAAGADPEQRVRDALERAQQRYRLTPEGERGLPPLEAIELLAAVCLACAAMGSVAQELPRIAGLPSLRPLAPAARTIAIVASAIAAMRFVQSGRHSDAYDEAQATLELTAAPEPCGLSEFEIKLLRSGALYTLGLIAAAVGHPRTREWVAELQREPGFRVNAWRVRMVYELMHGNRQGASACQRRAELLQLQDGDRVALFPHTTARVELLVHIASEDLLGIKHAIARIEELAAMYPGWRPTLALARSFYRRFKGDLSGALEALGPWLPTLAPGLHIDWGRCAAAEVELLARLGRRDEAIEHAQRYLALAPTPISPGRSDLLLAAATAFCSAGRTEEARALIDEELRSSNIFGTRGLRLALAYEARARLAIAMRDVPTLRKYAELCALEYGGGSDRQNLMLNPKYERLMREAEAADLSVPGPHRPLTAIGALDTGNMPAAGAVAGTPAERVF